MNESWSRRFLLWALTVWIAASLGGGAAGAVWGLGGFDCDGGPGRLEIDSPYPVASDPTATQLVSHGLAGAIRLELGAAAVAYVPAPIFAVSATVLGWALSRAGLSGVARWAAWIVLSVGAVGSVIWLSVSEMGTAIWPWVGLIVGVGLTAIGIEMADRPGSQSVFQSRDHRSYRAEVGDQGG